MNDLVSVIIPVYNKELYIKQAIDSVINQTYKNIEIIIVDDVSSDKSVEMVRNLAKKDSRIKLIESKKKLKAAGSRNTGIDVAKGRFIAYLDADDVWNKEKIEKQIKFMKKNNSAFSYTSYAYTNENLKHIKDVLVPYKINYYQALKNTTIFTSTVMFDLTKLKKEDIYMPNVPSEDTACWWSVLKKIDYAYGLEDVLSYYRRSDNTLSSNKLIAIKRIWNLYRKVEKLNILTSLYYFNFWAINAVLRRI
ncbi:MAG: glycosyltransferase family 2 protein [Bacilli bacterium]|nr:glycosyltransferase family 2 protein [Bacilli bacterium]